MSEVVVTCEPEWDDAERDQMLALAIYEAGVCNCGFHESQIDAETLHVTFEERVCPVCAGASQFARVQHERDQDADKRLGDDPKTPRAADGRRTFIRRMSPDEVEARRKKPAKG